MSTPPPPTTLTCGNCEHVNEAQRIYCHSCGEKLDRSVLPMEDAKKADESSEQARKRVQKMTNPTSGGALREVKTGAKVLGWAMAVALIVQGVREPEGIPGTKSEEMPKIISSDLPMAMDAPQPQRLEFTQLDVNSHLRSVKRKVAANLIPGIDFERAVVRFDPGVCHAWMDQSIAGFSFYIGISYEVQMVDGKLTSRVSGGSFGRVAIHPLVMSGAGFLFGRLETALKRERSQLDALQSVAIEKGRVVLMTKGKK